MSESVGDCAIQVGSPPLKPRSSQKGKRRQRHTDIATAPELQSPSGSWFAGAMGGFILLLIIGGAFVANFCASHGMMCRAGMNHQKQRVAPAPMADPKQ